MPPGSLTEAVGAIKSRLLDEDTAATVKSSPVSISFQEHIEKSPGEDFAEHAGCLQGHPTR